MKKLFAITCIVFTAVFFLASNMAYAQSKPNIQGNLGNFGQAAYGTKQTRPLAVIAGNIINSVLGILGILAVIYLVYGGFRWMTAGGDEGTVTEAKNIIKNAVIGLAIILSSYAIANFVTGALLQATVGS